MSAEYSLQSEIKYSLISCQDKWQKYAAQSKRTGEWLMVQRERTECVSGGIVISSIMQSQLDKLLLATFYVLGTTRQEYKRA